MDHGKLADSTEIVLNNVGVESFLKHRKEYRDELDEIRKIYFG